MVMDSGLMVRTHLRQGDDRMPLWPLAPQYPIHPAVGGILTIVLI
jgi:hypothetical protein